jgi:citrate synthase
MSSEWISSAEAARRLGVSSATLYAYVSRGLLRSEGTSGRRERRYRADDVSQLKRRRSVGRKAEAIAAHALDFGTPVLESALTLIEDGRIYYRGHDATRLARSASLEQIAQLLWDCDDRPFDARNLPAMSAALRAAWAATPTLSTVDRCLVLLPAAARWDHPSWVEDRPAMLETGVRILRLLTGAVTSEPVSPLPAHEQLALAWRVPPRHATLLRAALVLSADHEFNASTFAARVVASTGTHLYGSAMAGLAAINGPRHGGVTRQVARLFEAFAKGEEIGAGLGDLPGFGHPLYPDGDVRAATLLEMMREQLPHSPELALAGRLAGAVEAVSGRKPNIDFATVTLERALGLPGEAALALFLLGRTAGWIAHALEQAAHGGLIRPRARYVGPRPPT